VAYLAKHKWENAYNSWVWARFLSYTKGRRVPVCLTLGSMTPRMAYWENGCVGPRFRSQKVVGEQWPTAWACSILSPWKDLMVPSGNEFEWTPNVGTSKIRKPWVWKLSVVQLVDNRYTDCTTEAPSTTQSELYSAKFEICCDLWVGNGVGGKWSALQYYCGTCYEITIIIRINVSELQAAEPATFSNSWYMVQSQLFISSVDSSVCYGQSHLSRQDHFLSIHALSKFPSWTYRSRLRNGYRFMDCSRHS
jgi:hypothetical protein